MMFLSLGSHPTRYVVLNHAEPPLNVQLFCRFVQASQMHPTQTSALHQVFNALQRSGIDFRGSSTGVYVGCAGGSPSFELDMTECREYYMTGSSLSIVANRVSFIFDMMGPSLPVDTACSSSLTAMHLASQAIRNGECDQAVVVGVNLIIGRSAF